MGGVLFSFYSVLTSVAWNILPECRWQCWWLCSLLATVIAKRVPVEWRNYRRSDTCMGLSLTTTEEMVVVTINSLYTCSHAITRALI